MLKNTTLFKYLIYFMLFLCTLFVYILSYIHNNLKNEPYDVAYICSKYFCTQSSNKIPKIFYSTYLRTLKNNLKDIQTLYPNPFIWVMNRQESTINKIKIMQNFLSKGININHKSIDSSLDTALYAAIFPYDEFLDFILKHNPSLKVTDFKNRTPLEFALTVKKNLETSLIKEKYSLAKTPGQIQEIYNYRELFKLKIININIIINKLKAYSYNQTN